MKYSIILPVRNGGAFVKECITSILTQTFTDFNLHVLDNNSSDGSLEWINALGDNRIIVYPSLQASGIEGNWKRIVTIPKNEYMTIIGHDDFFHAHYLLEMNDLIKRHPDASLYQAHYVYIDATGKVIRPCLPMCEVQYANEFLSCHMTRTMDSMGSGYLMRSRDYDSLGGIPPHYPNLIFADYELWTRLMMISYKATTFRNCFSYRLHQNLSLTTNGMQYQQAFGFYISFLKEVMQQDVKIHAAVSRYGMDMLYYFCESLSHRLLKTPMSDRTIKVMDYIKSCEAFAKEIIPGQPFKPLDKIRIRLAKEIDDSSIGRGIFNLYKKITNPPK
jgi:glycosyltransferase involved in cell wall biosynthesis